MCDWKAGKWHWPLTDKIEIVSAKSFYRDEIDPVTTALLPEEERRVHAVYYVKSRRLYLTQTRLILLSEHVSLLF